MSDYRQTINPAILHDLLTYDPETGALAWRPRSEALHAQFSSGTKTGRGRVGVWNTVFAGKPAGSIHRSPGKPDYLRVRLTGHRIMLHNVVWAMQTGAWPPEQSEGSTIDHKDRDGLNNRWVNLRLATHSEQANNKRPMKLSDKPDVGVTPHRSSFVATLRGRYLGCFRTIEQARQARADAVAASMQALQ